MNVQHNLCMHASTKSEQPTDCSSIELSSPAPYPMGLNDAHNVIDRSIRPFFGTAGCSRLCRQRHVSLPNRYGIGYCSRSAVPD